jgi:hypothetical protein
MQTVHVTFGTVLPADQGKGRWTTRSLFGRASLIMSAASAPNIGLVVTSPPLGLTSDSDLNVSKLSPVRSIGRIQAAIYYVRSTLYGAFTVEKVGDLPNFGFKCGSNFLLTRYSR